MASQQPAGFCRQQQPRMHAARRGLPLISAPAASRQQGSCRRRRAPRRIRRRSTATVQRKQMDRDSMRDSIEIMLPNAAAAPQAAPTKLHGGGKCSGKDKVRLL